MVTPGLASWACDSRDYGKTARIAVARVQNDFAGKVTDNLGGLGLFGVELFVKDDMVWFSEVSPRPLSCGAGGIPVLALERA